VRSGNRPIKRGKKKKEKGEKKRELGGGERGNLGDPTAIFTARFFRVSERNNAAAV
jgi:hypothetical protein